MEGNDTGVFSELITQSNASPIKDIREMAMSYMMYKVAMALNKFYLVIIIPPGIVGNILSFLVMIQKHNRHMSFSLYISVLAITDTITLLAGFSRYLNEAYLIIFPPNQLWYCKYYMTIFMTASFCSTLFIISMTFDRFYSIIRPHKAASFNTIKRAKVTIFCIGLFSIIYNIPHIYLTLAPEGRCTSYLNPSVFGKIYYWISISFKIVVPFTSLLTMNGFIILALAERSRLLSADSEDQVQGHNQGQGQRGRMSSSEKQIYITLLLVTFSFLMFMAPSWFSIIYYMFVDYQKSPRSIAGFYLSHSIMQKAYYTNYSINFILYVISGQKIRSDLVKLFTCTKLKSKSGLKLSSHESETQISSVKSEL